MTSSRVSDSEPSNGRICLAILHSYARLVDGSTSDRCPALTRSPTSGGVSLGYSPNGRRRIGTVSAKTKTEAKNKLRTLLRDKEDGLPITQRGYTIADAVESWLDHGLVGRDPNTIANRRSLAKTHLLPDLGRQRLAQLTAEDVDAWLGRKSSTLSRDTLQRLLSILRHSIRRAQARDLVKGNVAMLCDVPKGAPGRPSKSLTLAPAPSA